MYEQIYNLTSMFFKSHKGNLQGKRILNTSKINTKQSIVFKNLKKH